MSTLGRVKLTVIGCSGSLPGSASPASCYLVEAGGARVVLDFGNGAVGPLQRHTGLGEIDAILLSHLHPDHCADLCGYHVALRYWPGVEVARVPVWGPAGTADRVAQMYGPHEEPTLTSEFDFVTYPDGEFEAGPFRVQAQPVEHVVPAYALRLTYAGRTLVYSGDTGVTPNLTRAAEGCDLLLCEAGFPDGVANPPGIHLTGREAGEVATRAGVGRLVVTHVPPWGDEKRALAEAAGAFGGLTELAHPGMVVDL